MIVIDGEVEMTLSDTSERCLERLVCAAHEKLSARSIVLPDASQSSVSWIVRASSAG